MINQQPDNRTSWRKARLTLPTLATVGSLGLFLFFGSIAGPVGSQVHAKAAGPELALAIEAQRSLIDESPTDAALYSDLGNLMTLDQQWVAAEEAYRSSLALAPDFVPAQFNLALLLQRKGEPEEALTLLDSVVATEPGHAWAHYQRGRIFQAVNDRRAAVDAYASAFAADPELTFSDVNPHLTENPYAIEAILEVDGSRIALDADTAPRSYDDASRIVQLLIPSPEPDESSSEETSSPDQGSSADAPSSTGGSAGLVQPQGEDLAGSERSLRSDDLDALGSFNQATPQPGASSNQSGRVVSPRGTPTRGVPAQSVIGVRPGTNQQGGAAGNQQGPATSPANTPEINRTRPRPRPGTGFRPGARSSAQLHLQLERSTQSEAASPAP